MLDKMRERADCCKKGAMSRWQLATSIRLINRSGMYQGTTFSRAERSAGKAWALAPAKTISSGAEAHVVVDPLRHG
jgi:hypothetical protein